MASFFGNENLLAFKGAKLMTGLDEEHPQCLYVCIPVPYNDIQVSRDGRYANAAVFMAETNDKFRQACIQRRQQMRRLGECLIDLHRTDSREVSITPQGK